MIIKNKIQTIISFLLSLKIKNEVLAKREMQKRLKNASREMRDGSFKINTKSTGMSAAARKTLREKLKIK